MNILRVIWSMDPSEGGPCQGIRNSIPEQAKYGVHTEVLTLDSPESAFIKNETFPINAIGERSGPWAYNSKLIPWLINNFVRFDAIIVHGLWQYHSYATLAAVQRYIRMYPNRLKPKIYIMPHGMLDPWFQRDKSRRLKALRNEIYWHLIEKKVVNQADGLLFTCQQELLLARETFTGYKPKKELNVSYGIQPPPNFSIEMKIAFEKIMAPLLEKPYFLFLSRIHPKKGVDLLIDAYIVLESENILLPDLVIAGPIEGEYGKYIRQKASSSLNIHFADMLQGSAKWGAFYGCEAFILPSHQENFGISVVEALACGKPVLISNQVNIWSEIKEADAGIVEEDSLAGVLKMLKGWLSITEEKKIIMRQNAKDVYESKFAIGPAAAEFLSNIKLNIDK